VSGGHDEWPFPQRTAAPVVPAEADSREFWLVWNPQGNTPQHRHGSEASAQSEAARLAREVKGQRFYVLHATEYRVVNEVQRVVLDDGAPF
jgi:hypothetical protein